SEVVSPPPAKLAASAFQSPPYTTLLLRPRAPIKPLATGLTALPLTTAIFGAITIVFLDRTLSRCDLVPALRLPLVLLFALNPLIVFYAGNGMSEMVYLAAPLFTIYCLVSWIVLHGVRWLFGAGFGFSVLVLTRYGFVLWVLALAFLRGIALLFCRAYPAGA